MLLIASRVDAFARSGEVDLEINPRAIANVLNFSANLAPETIFTSIHRLIPGAPTGGNERQARVEKYWDIRYNTTGAGSEARLSQELESVVESSVAILLPWRLVF